MNSLHVRPDQMPVLGPKLLSGDNSTSCFFNGKAFVNWYGPDSVSPLVDGRRLDAQEQGQRIHGADLLGCVGNRLERLSHCLIIRHHLTQRKALPY